MGFEDPPLQGQAAASGSRNGANSEPARHIFSFSWLNSLNEWCSFQLLPICLPGWDAHRQLGTWMKLIWCRWWKGPLNRISAKQTKKTNPLIPYDFNPTLRKNNILRKSCRKYWKKETKSYTNLLLCGKHYERCVGVVHVGVSVTSGKGWKKWALHFRL